MAAAVSKHESRFINPRGLYAASEGTPQGSSSTIARQNSGSKEHAENSPAFQHRLACAPAGQTHQTGNEVEMTARRSFRRRFRRRSAMASTSLVHRAARRGATSSTKPEFSSAATCRRTPSQWRVCEGVFLFANALPHGRPNPVRTDRDCIAT